MPAPESWPYIAAGITLHLCYQLFLLVAYRDGDLTQVYPIARGSAPLLVAGVSVLWLGTDLGSMELLAVLVIATGIMSLSLVRQKDGLRNRRAAMLALATGAFTGDASLSVIGALAADVMAEAIVRAVKAARGIGGYPSVSDLAAGR